jgi:hypothetical protein
MNKRGLMGKIFAVLGIIILLILIIAGITAYQGYRVYKTIMTEQKVLEENAIGIQEDMKSNNTGGICTKLNIIVESTKNIKIEVLRACKNPLIRTIVAKVMANNQIELPSGKVSPNCANIEALSNQAMENFKPIQKICSNQTRID